MKKDLIPLRAANLCVNCEQISHGHLRCPGCGSSALFLLQPMLDRIPTATTLKEFTQALAKTLDKETGIYKDTRES